MERNLSEKWMLHRQKKKSHDHHHDHNNKKMNRLLISINVLGSAGPLRFVVNEDDSVAAVIDTALKIYSREGRLPLLGSDVNNFLLYCANVGSDALSPEEAIGSKGGRRNFVLCKKQRQPQMTEGRSEMIAKKASGWKAWIKSSSFKILSH